MVNRPGLAPESGRQSGTSAAGPRGSAGSAGKLGDVRSVVRLGSPSLPANRHPGDSGGRAGRKPGRDPLHNLVVRRALVPYLSGGGRAVLLCPGGKALLRGPGRRSPAAERATGATPGTVGQAAAGLSAAVVGYTFESQQLARHRPAVRPARCLLRGFAGSGRSGGLRCSLALQDGTTKPERAIRRMHASPERPH